MAASKPPSPAGSSMERVQETQQLTEDVAGEEGSVEEQGVDFSEGEAQESGQSGGQSGEQGEEQGPFMRRLREFFRSRGSDLQARLCVGFGPEHQLDPSITLCRGCMH